MKYGLFSGVLWAVDTVVLGFALSMTPFLGAGQASVASAFLHDLFVALILLIFMGLRGRLGDTIAALKVRGGRVIMLAALLGGPLGMSGYLTAIDNIGPGYTAAISAFYPAVGSFLAVLILRERMNLRQVAALLVALTAVVIMGWSSVGATSVNNPLMGLFGALLCVFGWGLEAVILAWGMGDEMVDNETALQIRETTSAFAYGIFVVPVTGSLGLVSKVVLTPANTVVFAAALAGTMSYLFYYKAINIIGAARGMALNISYSAWAVFFAAIAMGNLPTWLEIVCCVAIICGAVLSASPNWHELMSDWEEGNGERE